MGGVWSLADETTYVVELGAVGPPTNIFSSTAAGPVFNIKNPKYAGGAPGPTGDNYPAILAAVDDMIAHGGGTVWVPYDTYPMSQPFPCAGSDKTIPAAGLILCDGASYDLAPVFVPMEGFGEQPMVDASWQIAGNVRQHGLRIENMRVNQRSEPLAQGIYIDQAEDVTLRNVRVEGGAVGWNIARANSVRWEGCETYDMSDAGRRFLANYPTWAAKSGPVPATPQFYDISVDQVYVSGGATSNMTYGCDVQLAVAIFYHGGGGTIRAPGSPYFMKYGLHIKYPSISNFGGFFEQLQLDAIWDGSGVPGAGAALYIENAHSIWFPTLWAGGYSASDGGGGNAIVLKNVRDIHFPSGHINGDSVQMYGQVDGCTFGQIGAVQSVFNAVGARPLFVMGATAPIAAGVDLTAPTVTMAAPTAGKFDPDGGSVAVPTSAGAAILAYGGTVSGAWGKIAPANGIGPVTAATTLIVDITGSNPFPSSGQLLGRTGSYTTLTAAMTDTTGTIATVGSRDVLGSVEPFVIQIDSEKMLVTTTGTGAGDLTVARGYAGTTPATHLNGTTVTRPGITSQLACFNYSSVSVVGATATFTLTTSGQGAGNFAVGAYIALVGGPTVLTGCSITSTPGPTVSIAGVVSLQGCSIGPNGISHAAVPVFQSTTFPVRNVSDGVLNGTTLATSLTANFTPNDIGKALVGSQTLVPIGAFITAIANSAAASTQTAGGPTLTLASGSGFQSSGTLSAQDATGTWQILTYSSVSGAVFTISGGWLVDIPKGALVYQASAATISATALGSGTGLTFSIVGDWSIANPYSNTSAQFISHPINSAQGSIKVRVSATGTPAGITMERADGRKSTIHSDQTALGVMHWADTAGVDQLAISTAGIGIGPAGIAIKQHLSAAVAWDPPSIDTGAFTTTTVTVTGAALGNTVVVGFGVPLPDGCWLQGKVSSTNTVTVTLFNLSGSTQDLVSGTLRADVWQH